MSIMAWRNPLLLFIDRLNIRSYDLETGTSGILLPSVFRNAVAMDFHHTNQMLYVSDVVAKKIFSVNMSMFSPTMKVIVDEDLDIPDGLAVDWINNNLYWTDTGRDQINVMNLDSKKEQLSWTKICLNRELFFWI